MALDDRHILTCAHVVGAATETDLAGAAPPWPVDVDLVGQPGTPTVPARVVPGCWAPPTDDGRGDVALLKLAAPLPHGPFAPLRRLRPWGRRVVVCGFPEALEHGAFVRARLAGPAGAGRERVQMDPVTIGPQVSPGFSGAAVVDEITGHVVGMVVSTYRDGDGNGAGVAGTGLSWMIPVETILHYLPRVRDHVSGEPSVDVGFLLPHHTPADPSTARRIADFFGQRVPANVLVIVTVHPQSGTAAAVRQAAVLSNRELRPSGDRAGEPDEAPAVPPVGSIDLAVDTAGKSTGEVSRRIADWTGGADDASLDRAAETPPRALIINNIDEATEPETLLAEVVLPLVDQAPARDLRMLLTFRSESVPLRIALLASRIATLQSTEDAARRAYRAVAPLVADPPQVPARATRLRVRLTALRAATATAGPESLAARLASTERATDRASREAESVRQQLVALEERWSELRGRLDGFLAMAVRHGLSEDSALSPFHRRAYQLLTAGRCDLLAADAAVRRYTNAVLHRVEAQRERGVG
ncbi:trypsin-like peptidase domain-containing protein [Micromonospora sp. NPDC092111]|uniref:trypsin-like peptidase domain-containing protein n=1 Tax=Micromonospora sp. NPDC092111 TaxID=3364289 RepID=UPI00381DA5B6